MSKINFEDRVVAFIDILGFKTIVNNARFNKQSFAVLNELIEMLSTAVPSLNKLVNADIPEELIPKHICISDSIILSAPLSSAIMPDYCGLSVLVMRVIQLTQLFLSKGYLIRGGISSGKVWHGAANIVGPAYQEAYEIEVETSAPRVVLSQSAKELWAKNKNSDMCLCYRNCLMVNGLNYSYIPANTDGAIEKVFQGYVNTANHYIATINNESARYKWWWFKEFLDSEIRRHNFIIK